MDSIEAIEKLDAYIRDPGKGLPEEVFLFISRITPLVNVDLLIRDERNYTLLSWRDDGYSPPGWHVPGGIIRFKESAADRIRAVAKSELGAQVQFEPNPLAIKEVIHPVRKDRGHFISLLYRCSLASPPDENLRHTGGTPRKDQWSWHSHCPDNIIDVHEMYREFIGMASLQASGDIP
jgi:ADP-ribose pyrophosphatase YjhB (NUDIX family)